MLYFLRHGLHPSTINHELAMHEATCKLSVATKSLRGKKNKKKGKKKDSPNKPWTEIWNGTKSRVALRE